MRALRVGRELRTGQALGEKGWGKEETVSSAYWTDSQRLQKERVRNWRGARAQEVPLTADKIFTEARVSMGGRVLV